MKTITKIAIGLAVVAAAMAVILPRVLKPKETFDPVVLPVVALEQPQAGTIELTRGLIGNIEPSDMVTVTPKLAGEITEVNVKAGDYVTEGQVICRIDTKQVDSAKISLDTASVSLADARASLARMQVLYQSGDISQQSYEQAVNGEKMAALQYQGAKLAYDTQVEYSAITAPISGLVESSDVEVHDMVTQQNLICVISAEGSRAVSFSVTESVIGNLKTGDIIKIEKGGSEYDGRITEVSSMIDAATGLFKIKASVDQADALPTGTAVKLYVTSDRAEHVLTIPVNAVYYEGGNPFVYTYVDNKVSKTPIETGIFDAEKMEVISGLTPEDQVITTWSSELYEGASVTIEGEEAQTAETDSTEQQEGQ